MNNMSIKMAKMGSELKPKTRIVNGEPIVMPNKFVSNIDPDNKVEEKPTEVEVIITSAQLVESQVKQQIEQPTITAVTTKPENKVEDINPLIENTNQQTYDPLQILINSVNEMETKAEVKDFLTSRDILSEFDLRMSLSALKEKVIEYLTDQNTIALSE